MSSLSGPLLLRAELSIARRPVLWRAARWISLIVTGLILAVIGLDPSPFLAWLPWALLAPFVLVLLLSLGSWIRGPVFRQVEISVDERGLSVDDVLVAARGSISRATATPMVPKSSLVVLRVGDAADIRLILDTDDANRTLARLGHEPVHAAKTTTG